MKIQVSVMIPIKNEGANLSRFLEAISWVDEMWAVDSASSDGSQALCKRHGAKVVQFEFNGTWPKKKNWALESLPFKHKCFFLLDAEEVLLPSIDREITERRLYFPEVLAAKYAVNYRRLAAEGPAR